MYKIYIKISNNSFLMKKYCFLRFPRFLSIDLWKKKLNSQVLIELENYWKVKFSEQKFYDENNPKNKYYLLSMFPYSSGSLHMGHIRLYSVSDVLAHYYRMNGKNVFQPIGWDSFGLPAENAAYERNIPPDTWTKQNIKNMKEQFKKFSLSFDWEYEISTCDPKYYKWTQFIFLKLFDAQLVYRKEALVNWDPVDNTVLADEQVDENGISWRSGAKVSKRVLKQWFIRTTKFAKDLYDGLDNLDTENWKDIITIQRKWIDECRGYSFDFKLENNESFVNVWVQNPSSVLKAEFIVVKPNSLVDILSGNEGKEGKLNIRAINPFNNRPIPIFVSENIKFPFKRDIRLGIPSIDKIDEDFAIKVNLTLEHTFEPDMSNEEICKIAQQKGIGGFPVNPRLNDWLISRQRYWGTPIPIVHCKQCGIQPVPYEQLPVRLPSIPEGYKIDKKLNILLEDKNWRETKCPKCAGYALRETNTMDTFVDSSWYYLRYLDYNNEKEPFSQKNVNQIMPVNLYAGGKEHALLHLFYARFMSYFLHSIGLLKHPEPFTSLLCQGKVRNKTFRNSKGRYLKQEEVKFEGEKAIAIENNEELIVTWEKMSKSKFNGVEPVRLLNLYGADTIRLYILGKNSPYYHVEWDEKMIFSTTQWQYRMWLTIKDFLRVRSNPLKGPQPVIEMEKEEEFLKNQRNLYVTDITHLTETKDLKLALYRLREFTAILRKPTREVRKYSKEYEKCLGAFLIMLAPFAPHFASTLWYGFCAAPGRFQIDSKEINWNEWVIKQSWPKVDSDYEEPVDEAS